MPSFGRASSGRLATAHPVLRDLFERVVETHDCTIVEAIRSEEQQREYLERGVSQTMDSWHLPRDERTGKRVTGGVAWAMDVAPYPIEWTNETRFRVFGGFVLAFFQALKEEGLTFTDATGAEWAYADYYLRWGGDWNRNWRYDDQSFNDLPHFELRLARVMEEAA